MKLYEAISKYGSKWAEISYHVFNSSRPENQIKNRKNSAAFRKFVIKTYGQEAFDAMGLKQPEGTKKRKGLGAGSASKKVKLV